MEERTIERGEKGGKAPLLLPLILGVGVLSLIATIAMGAWLVATKSSPKSLERENVVKVSGVGKVKRVPNKAVISTTVTKTAPTEQEAQQQLSSATTELLNLLKQYGVEENDLKTTGYYIYEEYSTEELPVVSSDLQGISGQEIGIPLPVPTTTSRKTQRASHDVQITLHETNGNGGIAKKANDVAQIVTTVAGVKFNNIQFTLNEDDQKSAESEAQSQAVKNARERALNVAKESGKDIGEIIVIDEALSGDLWGGLMSAASLEYGASGLDSVSTGTPGMQANEIEVTSTIDATFELK